MKRGMIALGMRYYLMVDHGKFGRTALHRVAELTAFGGLVNLDRTSPDAQDKSREDGIESLLAEGGEGWWRTHASGSARVGR